MPHLPTPKRNVYSERQRTREEAIAGFRRMADLLEQHPDEVPVPNYLEFAIYVGRTSYAVGSADDRRERVAALLRVLPGTYTRHEPDDGSSVMTWQGDLEGVLVSVRTEREAVCERVVLGTETVTIAARGGVYLPPIEEARTETREIVEWRCAPVLAPTAEASA